MLTVRRFRLMLLMLAPLPVVANPVLAKSPDPCIVLVDEVGDAQAAPFYNDPLPVSDAGADVKAVEFRDHRGTIIIRMHIVDLFGRRPAQEYAYETYFRTGASDWRVAAFVKPLSTEFGLYVRNDASVNAPGGQRKSIRGHLDDDGSTVEFEVPHVLLAESGLPSGSKITGIHAAVYHQFGLAGYTADVTDDGKPFTVGSCRSRS